jgi:hypothetical protein
MADKREYLTPAEIAQLRDERTMGDVWRADKEKPEAEVRGALILWHTATRIGMHAGDVESLLDRIREVEMRKFLQEIQDDADSK